MGRSRDTIELLCGNLEEFINDPRVVYEQYRELPNNLEAREISVMARVALYFDSEDSITKAGAEKPADSRQRFGIDISVVRGYRNDGAQFAENIALDLKDKVIDWIKSVDPFQVTNGAIHSFGYDGATGFTRLPRYTSVTLRCSGQKDLLIQQST